VVIGNRGAVAACEKEYVARFPHLKGVRDSVKHMEASGRGLDKNEKPLKLKPIDNSMIHAPQGGVLALNSLNNNVFGTTMNDGSCGEVEVSRRSSMKAQAYVQRMIECFKWRGPMRHYPSAVGSEAQAQRHEDKRGGLSRPLRLRLPTRGTRRSFRVPRRAARGATAAGEVQEGQEGA
jgi:hypothetical protein